MRGAARSAGGGARLPRSCLIGGPPPGAALLPRALLPAVERAIAELQGGSPRIAGAEPATGGCVNPSARLVTEDGASFFLKWNPHAPAGMFAAEADGLRALRGATGGALRVPAVLAAAETAGDAPAWLLLEWVSAGRPGADYAAALGAGLADLHGAGAGTGWGWDRDGFIGPLAQANPADAGWGELWRDARLGPQLEHARRAGHFGGASATVLERVLDRTPALLADVEGETPSLLHGDLWGGNVYPDGDGRPVLIDPSAYRGHHEVDLAMSELFGGFPPGWPDAYDRARAIEPAYREFRRGLYQLYYLLVHVNLFGAGYEAACVRAAREALRGT